MHTLDPTKEIDKISLLKNTLYDSNVIKTYEMDGLDYVSLCYCLRRSRRILLQMMMG